MKWLFCFAVLVAYFSGTYGCKFVSCSSDGYKYQRCTVPGASTSLTYVSRIVVHDKYSQSPCHLGYSFGATRNEIWVDEGCRAKFSVCQSNQQCAKYRQVECSSIDYKYKSCLVGGSMTVRNVWVHLKHSSSSCTHGESFGTTGGSVWVDKGCRATFNVCYERKVVAAV